MKFPFFLALLCSASAASVAGEQAKEPSGTRYEVARRALAAKTRAAAESAPLGEVFKKIAIEPGKSVPLDSALDFQFANTVAVTVYCSVCDTEAASLGASGLVLQATWALAEAETFVATETRNAAQFLYWDAGAAIFQVYGPVFRLNLKNRGTQGIVIDQVTVVPRL